MIFYAMLPNAEHPTFEAREMGDDVAKSILDNLDKGPIWGYLTEFDMGRLQGMVDACAMMNGSITIQSDPSRIGMLMINYENHSLFSEVSRNVSTGYFKFRMTQPMRPKILHRPLSPIDWQLGASPTMIVKFDSKGQPVDIPCAYTEPKAPPPHAG